MLLQRVFHLWAGPSGPPRHAHLPGEGSPSPFFSFLTIYKAAQIGSQGLRTLRSKGGRPFLSKCQQNMFSEGGCQICQKSIFPFFPDFPKANSQPNHNPLTPHASPDPPPGAGAAPFQGKLDLSGKSQPIPKEHPGHFFVFLHFFSKKMSNE